MMIAPFISAVRILTLLPIPGRGVQNESDAFYAFSIVGAIIGASVASLAWLVGGPAGWHAGAGVAGLAVSAWITRGLHMDGLGDTIDALFGASGIERRLQIMKDVHMGAFGVIAIVLACIVKTVAISRLAQQGEWLWIGVPFIFSRSCMIIPAVMLPYARKDGGKAHAIVADARARHLVTSIGTALILSWLLTGNLGLAALSASCLLAVFLAFWIKRAFGGVTGDLLGMTNEIVECAALFGSALLLPLLHA
jgi:adenosylcobinamide-GDP ribazoletransferase